MSDPRARKTQPEQADVVAHLETVADPRRRADALAALALVREVSGTEPQMWGPSIVGFGRQPYTTAEGREHEWFAIGLTPRKAALTLYGLTSYGSNSDLLERLGPHTTGKGCLYVKRLEDLDRAVLVELVGRAWRENHIAWARRTTVRGVGGGFGGDRSMVQDRPVDGSEVTARL